MMVGMLYRQPERKERGKAMLFRPIIILFRLFAKLIILPFVMAMALIKWLLVFLVSMSSAVFNILATMTFLTAVIDHRRAG